MMARDKDIVLFQIIAYIIICDILVYMYYQERERERKIVDLNKNY